MTVSFELTDDDRKMVRRLTERRLQRQFGPRWLVSAYWYGVLPVVIVVIAVVSGQPALAAVSLLSIAGLGWAYSTLYAHLHEKAYRAADAAGDHKSWTADFTEEALVLRGHLSEHKYQWAKFSTYDESRDFLFIRFGSVDGVYIPKRAFTDAQSLEQTKALVERRISKSA